MTGLPVAVGLIEVNLSNPLLQALFHVVTDRERVLCDHNTSGRPILCQSTGTSRQCEHTLKSALRLSHNLLEVFGHHLCMVWQPPGGQTHLPLLIRSISQCIFGMTFHIHSFEQ